MFSSLGKNTGAIKTIGRTNEILWRDTFKFSNMSLACGLSDSLGYVKRHENTTWIVSVIEKGMHWCLPNDPREKYQVVKVSPGGSHLEANWE